MLEKAQTQADEQGGKVCMVYLESPGNPTNALVDIEAVRASVDAAQLDCPIAIDNTFLGPLWQRPLDQGADIVVYSLTKYVGGHSDLVAGSVSGKKRFIDAIRMLRNTMGGICDPNTAWMLCRSLETVELRIEPCGRQCRRSATIRQASQGRRPWLSRDDQGCRSGYLIAIERQHVFAAAQGRSRCFRFLDALKIAKLAVSLGGTETPPATPAR